MSSPNLVCSTDFSLFMQEKPGSQTAVLLLIVIIISSKTVTTLKSSTLRQTKYLYISIIGLPWIFFPEIMANVSLTYHFETITVRTYIQDNRNARILNMYWKFIFNLFLYALFGRIFYVNTERNYQTKPVYKKEKFSMYD